MIEMIRMIIFTSVIGLGVFVWYWVITTQNNLYNKWSEW